MSQISLCLIVGNVEEYIERCLNSFLPIAAEVCLVRALGNAPPDATVKRARALCAARSVPFQFSEYTNAPEHADWPHVDSFAAARQMSFDLASHELCFWCDSDDVLESGADLILEHAARGGYDAYVFPYRIFGRGVNVPRERMMKYSAGAWRYPVHECFVFHNPPAHAVEDERVIVTHMPNVVTKTGSNDRNLRILKAIPPAELTAGLLFHLAGELGGAGDLEGCIAATQKALASPDLGRAERYDLLLNMAFRTKSPKEMSAILHAAFHADPRRREALFLLTNNALNFGENELAMIYGRLMIATHEPAVRDWNHRAACYGYAGFDLWQQVLRANGHHDTAELVRTNELRLAGGARIALLHATRQRPQQASQARKVWLDMANRPEQVEHIFLFDDDDAASQCLSRMHHLTVPAGGGCVRAWNAGLPATTAPVVIQMSDDWMPPMKWDELILERLGDVTQPKVLAVSDGHRTDELLCMAIATRAYLDQDGYLFHPRFKGVFSDNWFTRQAYARDAVIEARDLVFHHNHPAFCPVPSDATYAAQNAPERYAEGHAIFEELLCAHATP